MEEFNQEEKLLLIEGSLSAYALANGLDCLRRANVYEKGMYYQSFFSLSIGIERLLKLIIIYEYRIENDGKFPDNKVIKQKGHDLYEMISTIKPKLLENELYKSTIKFLSEFAQNTRYYNLNVLTGREMHNLNPIEEWNNIEKMILKEYNVKIENTPNKEEMVNKINQISDILFLDMNLNLVNKAEYIVNEMERRNIIQGYDVLVFYKIIRSLVETLTEYELKNNLFPYLREYFIYFRADYTDGEIRRKKSWRNITTGQESNQVVKEIEVIQNVGKSL